MKLSGLAVSVVLLVSSAVFAQHSSAGGSGSSNSSSSGSSHSSSFSSSSSSSGGHSATSSSGHGTTTSSSRSSSGLSSSRAGNLTSSETRTIAQPEKKTFVSRIFHPFRKPQREPIHAALRRPICPKGHCVCPVGESAENGVCSSPKPYHCGSGAYWNGGSCVRFTDFRVNDCASLALLMDQQSKRLGTAESLRQNSCSLGAPECADLTARSADEAARYRALQQQYERCRRRPFASGGYGFSFAGYGASGFRDLFTID
jgi:hypothetical protein